MNPDQVLKMSWQNLNLYNMSIPIFSSKEKGKKVINADDPKNKGVLKKLIQEQKNEKR